MVKTPTEALTLALELALTASTEAKAQECLAIAEGIASTLTPQEVEACKAIAAAKAKA